MNEIKVLHPVIPELNFLCRTRVVSRLESGLRILFKYVLDLPCPSVDRSLKYVSLVFV